MAWILPASSIVSNLLLSFTTEARVKMCDRKKIEGKDKLIMEKHNARVQAFIADSK